MKKLNRFAAAILAAAAFAAAGTGTAAAATQADIDAVLAAARQAQAAAEAAQAAALKAQAAAEAAQRRAEVEAARAKALADASQNAARSAEESKTAAVTAAASIPEGAAEGETTETAAAWKPTVDFHGYFRSGVGKSRHAGPTSYSKTKVGRLGNEDDTYGEIQLGSEVYKKDDVSFYVDSMVHVSSKGLHDSETSNSDETEFALRQFNLQIKGLIPWDKDAVIWAGKRYYQRHDLHIIDSKYWNVSGPGAGIEYLQLGPGKLSAAWIRSDSMDIDYRYDVDRENYIWQKNATNVNYIDLRYAGSYWNGGWLEVGVDVAIPDDADVTTNDGHLLKDGTSVYDNGTGVMLTAEVSQNFNGGYNKTVLQYFTGPLAHNAIDIGGGWYDSWNNNEDAWGISIINTGDYRITNRLAFTHVIHYGYAKDFGNSYEGLWDYDDEYYPGSSVTWNADAIDEQHSFNAVARISYQMTQYVRWLNEFGFFIDQTNYTSNAKAAGYSDGMSRGQKYTTALAIAPDIDILSRPELRFYVSYLHASDGRDIPNSYSSAYYGDDWNVGVQAEAWW